MSANQSPTRAECEAILHDRSKVQDFNAEYLKKFARGCLELMDSGEVLLKAARRAEPLLRPHSVSLELQDAIVLAEQMLRDDKMSEIKQGPTRAEIEAILARMSHLTDESELKRVARAHIALLDENAELRRRLGVVLAVGQDELNQDGWDGYELAKAAEALAEALGSARPYVYITDHAARQDTLIEIDAALAQWKALGRDKCADSERIK